MSIKRLLVLLAVVLLAAILVACQLSASTPPPQTLTSEGPMSTLQSELGNIATQTAAAAGGGVVLPTTQPPSSSEAGGGVAETATPTPEPTEAPTEVEPTEEPAEVSTATPGIPATYALQKGEWPFCIARRFNVNQYELLNINGLSLSSKPVAGFNLKIPQTGDHFAGDRSLRDHPTTYTVASGDTIYTIACRYGDVSPETIAEANDMKVSSKLESGETLKIP
ncbi:MAG TPA: LysM peptidoglycan-binding domain-containing protein [Anaerolineales bacterium]|jgi:LysM repeat protein|nr:LysM peptidoglycan-binding domain-containing protein [Anaerolineales bacterium]